MALRGCGPGSGRRLAAGHSAALVAGDSGYVDQSHLHRDVMTFAVVTPTAVAAAPWLAVDSIAWAPQRRPNGQPRGREPGTGRPADGTPGAGPGGRTNRHAPVLKNELHFPERTVAPVSRGD